MGRERPLHQKKSYATKLEQAQAQLAYQRRRLCEAAAPIVEEALWPLLDEIPQLWQRLRTIRETTLQLSTLLAGNISNRALSVAQAEEPLEANHVGFEVDDEFIAQFRARAEALLDDADVKVDAKVGD